MKMETLYYKVKDTIFRDNPDGAFERYENGTWIPDWKWFDKIVFGDFDNYENLTEKEAMQFIGV